MSMLGVIGGSGLYALPGLQNPQHLEPDTPFGPTSGAVTIGTLNSLPVCFLARHGDGHRLNPSEVPYKANIFALKKLGVTHLLSISAVGSLQEELAPGSVVIPDQIIDHTVARQRTFFENGMVAHVSMADPFCGELQARVTQAATDASIAASMGGTYLCIEGPQFSTRAESQLYRSWGAAVIGMTAMPEARLAREAGMCYTIVSTVTDYDVWHESEDDVSVEAVIRILHENAERGARLIEALSASGLSECSSGCESAVAGAIATRPEAISPDAQDILGVLVPDSDGATT